MARKSPARRLVLIVAATNAWQRLAHGYSFYGMSLPQFKADAQRSLALREEIADLTQRLRVAIIGRNAADAQCLRKLRGIGFAVKAHPDFGPDSDLCEALGYTRERDRCARIRRTKRRKR